MSQAPKQPTNTNAQGAVPISVSTAAGTSPAGVTDSNEPEISSSTVKMSKVLSVEIKVTTRKDRKFRPRNIIVGRSASLD